VRKRVVLEAEMLKKIFGILICLLCLSWQAIAQNGKPELRVEKYTQSNEQFDEQTKIQLRALRKLAGQNTEDLDDHEAIRITNVGRVLVTILSVVFNNRRDPECLGKFPYQDYYKSLQMGEIKTVVSNCPGTIVEAKIGTDLGEEIFAWK
jgi:hypothetical protein